MKIVDKYRKLGVRTTRTRLKTPRLRARTAEGIGLFRTEQFLRRRLDQPCSSCER
jgi:phosphoenolpyruvate-protein kinase (PTS system EI component)